MTEPEVILRIALYYLKNHLTDEDIYVSIDGAHVEMVVLIQKKVRIECQSVSM